MPDDPGRDWQHPWLRISRLLRLIFETAWDRETWRIVRLEIPKALAERGRIQRAGWFN
jgi:hypothetical protein